MSYKVDFLVIGSGIAGLSYALKAADHGSVLVITKSDEDESNTKYAQGGIAAVTYAPDSYEKHIKDTLDAGDGLCDEEIVRMVITESADRIKEMIAWGTEFDKTPSGKYDLAMEGGHSEHRVLHHKDSTGLEIETTLLEQIHAHPNIKLETHFFAVDLITQHHQAIEVTRSSANIETYGVYALDLRSGKIATILAKTILMAAGGAGNIYKTTTNPGIATGDGVAMVYRAKGYVKNMEFFQFHPTALHQPGVSPSFLISEAVRGAGAILRTGEGKEFMYDYDERGSLASRDIVARAIDNEMKKSGDEFVFLDCTKLDMIHFAKHFPNILNKCKSLGLDLSKDFIPVVPAAHYMCGGIVTDKNGSTNIKNLYAVGECACTGLHGANRLASNSLLEALVFSHRAFEHGIANFSEKEFRNDIPEWNAEGTSDAREMVLVTANVLELQFVMSNYVGIVRSDQRLKRAMDRLRIIYGETEAFYEKTVLSRKLCELRNMINVAYLIIKQAMERKENRGLHFNSDHTSKDESKRS